MRLGPAGRTFVVLGQRWELPAAAGDGALEVPFLQANLAFSEAYLADEAGSANGFNHDIWGRLYVNDMLWFLLETVRPLLSRDELVAVDGLGGHHNTKFPYNLLASERPIEIVLFHRKKVFRALMSHHTCDISHVLVGVAGQSLQ